MQDVTMGWPYLAFAATIMLIAAVAIAAWIGRWNREHRFESFASSEPEHRTTEEFRFELEDVHDPDDHPRTP